MSIMRLPIRHVNKIPQPPLMHTVACATTLSALVDHDEYTVVFVVETTDPTTHTLQALWSSAPHPLDRYLKGMHQAHKEFLKQLWDAAGPFA